MTTPAKPKSPTENDHHIIATVIITRIFINIITYGQKSFNSSN
jgi:hypothetical protein